MAASIVVMHRRASHRSETMTTTTAWFCLHPGVAFWAALVGAVPGRAWMPATCCIWLAMSSMFFVAPVSQHLITAVTSVSTLVK